jgi:hypothetical protein
VGVSVGVGANKITDGLQACRGLTVAVRELELRVDTSDRGVC